MRVIGTAGHVDHGKSTLVEALTGVHPDRLKEEREREMTIDLGFAWLTLPGGEEVGIIDVPGHRDFIENMLAGVGGVDAALFVIAADEGVMPQTREHLAILDLLQVQGGVVALTKTDLAPDADWLDMIEEDVRTALVGTVLEGAPMLRVSARQRQGLPQLLNALQDCLKDRPPRPDYGRPRLPVDRIFSIAGFGTVVTGTLSDGRLNTGDDVVVMPGGLAGRVRGLQTHKKKETEAVPGSRTAVNISGLALEQIRRGDVITRPGSYTATQRLDAGFKLLADASGPVKHNMEVKFYIGAAEVLARLRLLGVEELGPGEEGWLQLELAEPVVAVRGDRYILRRPSPGETIGGGSIVDPHPRGRHKRFSSDVIERLQSLARGTPAEILLQALLALGIAPLKYVISRSNLDAGAVPEAVGELFGNDLLMAVEAVPTGDLPGRDSLVTSRTHWENLSSRALAEVEQYHRLNPLRKGMPREELKSRLGLPVKLYTILIYRLVSATRLCESGTLVMHPGHEIRFSVQQQRQVKGLLDRFAAAPFAPPSVKESQAEVGEDVYMALLDLGELVQVSSEVVFDRRGYDLLVGGTRQLLQQGGSLTAAQVRDHFNTSRKYVLALLEHLDATGVTIRQGDIRRLK